MAKSNMLDECGVLLNPPKVTENKDKATFILVTTRGRRDTGLKDNNVRWDCIVVATKDAEIIEQISELEALDIVRIKGVVVTKPLPKKTICPHCKTINMYDGLMTYAEPIYLEKIAHANDEDEAKEMVYARREVSNELRIMGNICTDLSKIEFKNTTICQYQVAIPRTYRIKGSTDDDKTDYPWVKSYGKNAVEDLKRLKKSSLVLIDGCLQAREQTKSCECEQCGNTYEYVDKMLEIVPYETEYIKNYVTDDDLGIKRINISTEKVDTGETAV